MWSFRFLGWQLSVELWGRPLKLREWLLGAEWWGGRFNTRVYWVGPLHFAVCRLT